MKHIVCAAACAAASLLLSACAGRAEIPYDRSATPNVKIIGVLTPAFPDAPIVARASSVGQSFGLIGALVEAGLQTSRESKFKSSIAGQQFMARETFLKDVHTQLGQHGYKVIDVPAGRPDSSLLKAYPPPTPAPPVDAYLDVVVSSYGYVAAGVKDSTPYRPTLSIAVKLVNAKDSAVLLQDAIVYNPIGPIKDVVTVAPDPAYAFTDSDVLAADPKNAVKGMHAAIDSVTRTLGSLLK